jgi:hypothetical protein
MEPEGSLPCSQEPFSKALVTFRKKLIFDGEELLAPRPTSQTGGPPLVGCLRLLIQYIPATLHIWRPSPPNVGPLTKNTKF